MLPLLLTALLLQAGDAATTCQALGTGRYAEQNRLLGHTCASVVSRKLLVGAGSFVVLRNHRTAWAVSLAAVGGVGLTVNLSRR